MFDARRLRADLLALAVLTTAVGLTLCLLSYHPADPPATAVFPPNETIHNIGGSMGAWWAHTLREALGLGAYLIPGLLGLWSVRCFSRDGLKDVGLRLTGSCLVLLTVTIVLQLTPPVLASGPPVGSGGYIGAWGAVWLKDRFSPPGVMIVLTSSLLAGLVLANELRLLRSGFALACLPFTIWDRLAFRRSVAEVIAEASPEATSTAITPSSIASTSVDQPAASPSVLVDASASLPPVKTHALTVSSSASTLTELQESDEEDLLPPVSLVQPVVAKPVERQPIKVNPPVKVPVQTAPVRVTAPVVEAPPFTLPEESLLDDAEEFPYELLAQKAQIAAQTLEKTFREFGLNVKVVEIDTGPVITQFELELEAGLRLSKVTSLADDLAIALRVPSVRVVAPIPGKNTVGVEVPNDVRVMVRLKELLQSCRADFENKRIPLFLGKDVSGKPLVVDMAKMPHLLIAGRTGTGKSVCLNTLILSILLSRCPDQVKMLMIDPKMVELSPYMRIPHLMHPVITDMKKAEAVLGWAVDKMEERYDLLARVGVRHLDSYNKLGHHEVLQRLGIDPDSDEADLIPEQMPYIVIVADEMADMMMTSGKDVEAHIIRLAQKSRAVGIHLVLATQKPTVDVITGLIKSNLPARIAFQVSSRVDSRVVLDEQGADKLLGNGDMLFLAPGTSNLNRAQGTFVSDEEVMRIIDAFADQPPQYDAEIVQVTTAAKASGKSGSNEPRPRDDLYDQAVEVVIREGRGSVSLLQRALGVGYGRGARMIDWMAEDGVVGTYNGSQAREVIMTLDQWEEKRCATT